MSCPSYFIPQFSTVQVGQLIMYWGLELNVETTRHGSRSCFCKITLETTRAEATHAEATHEEVTHHSIVRNWKSQGGNISVDHLALHYLCNTNTAGERIERPTRYGCTIEK